MIGTLGIAAIGFAASAKKVSLSKFVDVLEACTITQTVDLGNTLIYKAIHPTGGNLVLVSSTGAMNAIISV